MSKTKNDPIVLSLVIIALLAAIALGITVYKNQLPPQIDTTQEANTNELPEAQETPKDTNKAEVFVEPTSTTPAPEAEIDAKLDAINRGVIDIDSSFNDTQIQDL